MYDGTNFMGIKGYDQCQFFESDVILGASGECLAHISQLCTVYRTFEL